MNKHMYLGLLVGLAVSIYVNSFNYFSNKDLVTVVLVLLGIYSGAYIDKTKREKEEKKDE